MEKKLQLNTLMWALVIFAGSLLFVVGAWVNLSNENNRKSLAGKLKIPGVIINNFNFILIKDIIENTGAVKKFYESQNSLSSEFSIDFSGPEGDKKLRLKEKEVIDKMIEDRAIIILAKKRGIKISKAVVDENVAIKLKEYGDQKNVEDNLMVQYGWTLKDFKEKIVTPSMYADLLKRQVQEELNDKNVQERLKIEEAKNALDEGKSFEDVARKYSQGSSSQEGGGEGWFKEDQLDINISKETASMVSGDVGGITESNAGFHIIRMDDKKVVENQTLVKISQVFVAKKTFEEWLFEEIKKMNIYITLKDYRWASDAGVVEFKNNDLAEFEKREEEIFLQAIGE